MPFFKKKNLHKFAMFYVTMTRLLRLWIGVIDGELLLLRNTKAEYKDSDISTAHLRNPTSTENWSDLSAY